MMRATAILLLLSGCYVPHRYVIDAGDFERVRVTPPEVVNATRVKDGKAVHLRASTLLLDTAEPQATTPATPPRIVIKSRAKSQMLLAGHLLTWIGSAISITGTLLYLIPSTDTLKTTGLILAPSAEPLMITGTVLWVLSLIRHPQEVP